MTDLILVNSMHEMLKETSLELKRYMWNRINWNARMIGLTGPRGVGKSTLMLQYILSHPDKGKMLYVSADNMYFATHSLVELADNFVKDGGCWLCVDEAHKYAGWSRELKQIYDTHPKLRIAFTGSSVLDISKGEADLSRRALMYYMQGLSFREYLKWFHDIDASTYTLEEILSGKPQLPQLEHPLPLFKKYLAEGYYPFAMEGDLAMRLQQVVTLTVEGDIPMFADMKATTARKLKQLLGIVAESAPFKPSAENLASEIKVSKNNIPDYLAWLEKAGMIGQLRDDTSGLRSLGKVEKVYLDNPTLMSVLAGPKVNTGNLRETFFYNQMKINNQISASKISDFKIGDFTFEIGGRKKGQKQIEGIKNGIIVRDDIETAYKNIIPLYYFGLNY